VCVCVCLFVPTFRRKVGAKYYPTRCETPEDSHLHVFVSVYADYICIYVFIRTLDVSVAT